MNILDSFISVLAPHDCLFCGQEGTSICTSCLLELDDPVPSRCFMCKKSTKDYQTCDKCSKKTSLRRVFVVSTYNDKIKKLVHSMKIGANREIASIIASIMNDQAPFYSGPCVSNVPTAPAHTRERSFDHSKTIAKEFAKLRDLEYQELLKRYDKSKQVGKTRAQRLNQLTGKFEVSGSNLPKSVIIIDDVVTTGASLNEVAKTLKRAGIKNISALVFAQTV